MRSVCAMCGDAMGQPYGGYSLPAFCVQLLDGGEEIDPTSIAGDVHVDLCEDCTEIGRRMIREYDTSPLPECDADAADWSTAGMVAAMSGDDSSGDELENSDRWREEIADAVAAVKAHQDGAAEHIFEGKIDAAYITVHAAEELGVASVDFDFDA